MGGKRNFVFAIVFIVLYVLLGNARSVKPNPYIDGAVIAVNMIVPVVAGIVSGKKTGAVVGFFGTLLNAISPAGSIYEFAAVIPHTIMGYTAGFLRQKYATPVSAFALLIGHILNIIMFLVTGLIQAHVLTGYFFLGIAYESFFGIVAIIISVSIIKMGFMNGSDK